MSRRTPQERVEGPYIEKASNAESLPSGPFLEWWNQMLGRRERLPVHCQWRWNNAVDRGRVAISEEQICRDAGVSPRAISRARLSGTISLALVDRLLTRASHGAVTIDDLYPYEEYPSPIASRPQRAA